MPSAVSKSGDGRATPTSSRKAQGIPMQQTRSVADIGSCYTRIVSCPESFHVCHPKLEGEGERDNRRLHELRSDPEAFDYPVN